MWTLFSLVGILSNGDGILLTVDVFPVVGGSHWNCRFFKCSSVGGPNAGGGVPMIMNSYAPCSLL